MYSIASAPWCLGAPMDDPQAPRACWRSVGRWTLRSESESAERSSLSCLSAGTADQSTHPWSLHAARTSPLTMSGWVPRPGMVRGTEQSEAAAWCCLSCILFSRQPQRPAQLQRKGKAALPLHRERPGSGEGYSGQEVFLFL